MYLYFQKGSTYDDDDVQVMDKPSCDLRQKVIDLTEQLSEEDKVHKSTVSQLISEKECIKEALERSEKKILEVEAQFDRMADLHKAVSV